MSLPQPYQKNSVRPSEDVSLVVSGSSAELPSPVGESSYLVALEIMLQEEMDALVALVQKEGVHFGMGDLLECRGALEEAEKAFEGGRGAIVRATSRLSDVRQKYQVNAIHSNMRWKTLRGGIDAYQRVQNLPQIGRSQRLDVTVGSRKFLEGDDALKRLPSGRR